MQQLFILAHRPKSAGGWLTQAGPPPWASLQAADEVRVCCTAHVCHPLRPVDYLVYVHMVMAEVQEDRFNCGCVTYADISFGKASHVTKLKVKRREG